MSTAVKNTTNLVVQKNFFKIEIRPFFAINLSLDLVSYNSGSCRAYNSNLGPSGDFEINRH